MKYFEQSFQQGTSTRMFSKERFDFKTEVKKLVDKKMLKDGDDKKLIEYLGEVPDFDQLKQVEKDDLKELKLLLRKRAWKAICFWTGRTDIGQ